MDMKRKHTAVCPKCGNGWMRVYCVRGEFPRIRYRKCTQCNYREKTVEN